MKRTLTALLLVISATTNAQIASRLLPSQAHVQPINAHNIVWIDTVAGGQQRIWVADRDSLKLYTFQIRGVKDSVQNWGDARYPQLAATYFNPTFIGSIAANKLTGLNASMINSAMGFPVADSNAVSLKLNKTDTTGKFLGSGYVPTWVSITGKPTFGTAATMNSTAFATAAQGALAATALQSEVDGSVTNELQTLTGSSRTITLSNGGGSYSIPFPPYDSLTGKPAAPSLSNTPARTLNTSYQISTTRNARVSYSVTHTVSLTLVLGSGSTTAFLEISPNNSTWTEINRAGYSKTLAVAVSAGDATTNNLVGEVPAGWWCRIRTAGTGGGLTSSVPNITYNSGQEVQY